MKRQTSSSTLLARLAGLGYSSCCYLVFLFTLLYMMGFVGAVVVPKHIDSGARIDWASALMINASPPRANVT